VKKLAALLLVLVATAPPAYADPSPTPQAPESPLKVSVRALLPRAPVRHDGLLIRGTVTNTGDAAISNARVRVAVGDVITLRGDLHEADTDRPPTTPTDVFVDVVPSVLEPGRTGEFALRGNVDDLGLRRSGVYPLDVEARGKLPDEMQQTLGQVPTWLPFFSTADGLPRPNKVAVALPFTEAPRQAPDGSFLDDGLATELNTGRLGNLLNNAKAGATEVPSCGAPEHGTEPGSAALKGIPPLTRCESVPITLAVDPDLLSAVDAMARADKYTVGLGKSAKPGVGKQAAQVWLDGVKELVARSTGSLLVLPYADPDVSALTSSEPGKGDVTNAMLLGDQVTSSLFSKKSVPVAWPSDAGVAGVLTQPAAETLASNGTRTFLLDESAYPQGDETSTTPSARTQLSYNSGVGTALYGLVADPELSELVTGTRQDCTCSAAEVGSRLAEQRFIAETALLAGELPGRSRTFVIAPDRGSEVGGSVLGNAIADLGRLPWLCPVPLASLAGTGEEACAGEAPSPAAIDTDRTDLRTSTDGLLPHDFLVQVGNQRDQVNQLTDFVLDGEENEQARTTISKLETRLKQAVFRAESSAWRDDGDRGQVMRRELEKAVRAEAGKISLAGGKLLLTSSKGTLSVSIQNSLNLPVKVRVQFSYLNRVDVTPLLTVGPKSAISASVKADAERSGKFVVTARMLDRNVTARHPNGSGFREATQLQVRSTQYGRLALGVTFAAAGVLFVAAGVRIVRRSLKGPAPEVTE
jgi:hypothetical protein